MVGLALEDGVGAVELLRRANSNQLVGEGELAYRPGGVGTLPEAGVKAVRSADQKCRVAQSPVHEALEVVGQLDGAHLRSVLVEEDEVVDTLKVFVGHGGLLLHHARRVGLGVLALEVGGFHVAVLGVPRKAGVVHLYAVFHPRLGGRSNGNQGQLHKRKARAQT